MSRKGPIIASIVAVIVIAIVAATALFYRMQLNKCQSKESSYCLTVTCPSDDPNSTCAGYAYRPSEDEGYVYCSYAPNTKVKV